RPMLLNAPRPNYSEEAREKKISGVVEMAVLIDENGNVGKVFLLSRLGHGLDEEAVRAVQELNFSPAMKDGKPAPFWQRISIEYNLK
ncbi:MAG TPA: energy transducer TonB, partial [Blastocatellia bacterium]|nr:energy transducer TonB [Blastocatellia bacterium]